MKYLKYFDEHARRESFQENNEDGTFIHYCEDQEHLHYLNSEQSIIDNISGNGAYNPYFNQWKMLEYIREHYGLELVEQFYTNDDNENDVYTLGNNFDTNHVYRFDSFEMNNNILPINEGNVGISMTSTNSNGFENINSDEYWTPGIINLNGSGDRSIRGNTSSNTRIYGLWPNIIVGFPGEYTIDSCSSIENALAMGAGQNLGRTLTTVFLGGGTILRLVEICSSNGMPDAAIYMTVNYTDYIFPGQDSLSGGGGALKLSKAPATRDINNVSNTPGQVDFPLMYVVVFFEDSSTNISETPWVGVNLYNVVYGNNSRAIGIVPIQQFVHTPYYINTSYWNNNYYGIG